jgi:hypothetical protein
VLVAEAAWQQFARRPFAGYGTGSAREIEGFEIGTHNIYLANLVDHGIVGLFIVPTLILAALWGANRKTFDVVGPFVLFLAMWGLFTHNLLEERYILLAVALVGSMVASARPRRVEEAARAPIPLPAGAVASA